MENSYPGGIVPLASDLSYLNGGSGRYWRDGREWANDSTNQHTANFNRETTRAETGCLKDVIGQEHDFTRDSFERLDRTFSFNRINDEIVEHDRRNSDNLATFERRLDDKLAAIAKEQAEASKEALKQFCDLKEQHKETQKAIEVTSLEAENRDLREQLAEQRHRECCPAPARCVDPCCNGGSSGGGDTNTSVILQAQAQQFQAIQQTMQSGFSMIAEAIKTIDTSPGNS